MELIDEQNKITKNHIDSLEVIDYLKQRGFDINQINQSGSSLLHYLSQNGKHRLIEKVLEINPKIEIYDSDNKSPIYYAVNNLHNKALNVLLKSTDPNQTKKNFNLALSLSSELGKKKVILFTLYSLSKINIKDKQGWTPLMYAVNNNQIKASKLLIKLDSNIKTKNNFGYTCLTYSCLHNNLNEVKFLLSIGDNINSKTGFGNTPLIIACINKNLEMVQFLLKSGADVNAKNQYDDTALITIGIFNNIIIAKELLLYGADPSAINKNGICAFDFCKTNNLISS